MPAGGSYGSLMPFGGSVVGLNDYIVSGRVYAGDGYDHAIVYRLNAMGNIVWSKWSPSISQFRNQRLASNGDVLLCGSADGNMLVARINQGGNFLWTKVLDTDDTVDWTFVYDIQEDSNGDIVIVGSKREDLDLAGSPEKELIVKLGSDGSLQWAKQLNAANNEFGFFNSVEIRADNSIDLFGVSGGVPCNISMFHLNSDGSFGCEKLLPTSSHEALQDVIPFQGGYILAFNLGSLVALMKVDNNLDLVPGGTKSYWAGGSTGLTGGIAADGANVYMTSYVIQGGISKSFLAKFDQNLNPLWLQAVDTNSFATVPPLVSGGQVMTISSVFYSDPVTYSRPIVMQGVEKVNGQAVQGSCEDLTQLSLTATVMSGYSATSITRTVEPVTFPVIGSLTFESYGFDKDSCLVNFSLPVTGVSLKASAEGQSVLVEWATATEHNNAHFTVEKSRDGMVFEEVGEIPGAGNSTGQIEYEKVDSEPFEGISYYRLSQTDFDGHTEVLGMVPVTMEEQEALMVYPNPVSQSGLLNIPTSKDGYEIVDGIGRVVKVVFGSTSVQELPVGQYVLRSKVDPLRYTKFFVN